QHDRLSDLYETTLKKSPEFPASLTPPPADGAKSADLDAQKIGNENQWLRGELRKSFLPANTELAALGSARGTAVRDALLTNSSSDRARVFLTTNETGEDNKGAVRLELKLR